jgi:hypothetical protein
MNSYPAPPNSNFIKKKGGKDTRGGTRPRPSEKIYTAKKKKQKEQPTDI